MVVKTVSRRAGGKAWYRVIWWSLAAPVVVVGAAGSFLLAGAGAAVLLALLGAAGAWAINHAGAELRKGSHRGHFRPPRPRLCLYGAAATLSVAGLILEIGGAGSGIALFTAATGWLTFRHRSPAAPNAARQDIRQAAHDPAPTPQHASSLPPPPSLASLTTARLCWLWRASYVRLYRSTSPRELDELGRLRRECLDQLEARDAAAFGHWFPTARAASDPARFFGCQPQP
jgi:hypothetical protein